MPSRAPGNLEQLSRITNPQAPSLAASIPGIRSARFEQAGPPSARFERMAPSAARFEAGPPTATRRLELRRKERYAPQLLRQVYAASASASHYASTKSWRTGHAHREALTLCRCVDLMVDQYGFEATLESDAVEVLMRRLLGLELSTTFGSWTGAEEVEEVPSTTDGVLGSADILASVYRTAVNKQKLHSLGGKPSGSQQ